MTSLPPEPLLSPQHAPVLPVLSVSVPVPVPVVAAAAGAAAAATAGAGAGAGAGGAGATVLDLSVMKLTRGHSCVLCQQRKVRCDKNKPCANCVKANVECRVVPPQPPRRRKKKPHERELVERLKKYEALLNQHGVTFEPITNEFKPSDPSTHRRARRAARRAGRSQDVTRVEQPGLLVRTWPGKRSVSFSLLTLPPSHSPACSHTFSHSALTPLTLPSVLIPNCCTN